VATAALFQPDPRVVRVADQIRAQQRVLAPRGLVIDDFSIDDMARQFVRVFGTDDLRNLDATPVAMVFYGEESRLEVVPADQAQGYALHLKGSEPLSAPTIAWGDAKGNRSEFEWNGGTRKVYNIHWNPQIGAPIFFLTDYQATPWWKPFVPMIGFALAFTGIGAAIGQAVLGAQTAAAYPALANAIGQVSIRTVLTGGDVEGALKSAATGFVGGEFGDLVGTALDSDVIGIAASAATEAALQGEDARKAVLTSLVTKGGTIVSELFPDPTEFDPSGYVYLPGYGDDGPPIPGLDYRFVSGGEITLDDLGLSFDLDEVLANLEMPDALTLPLDAIIPDDDGNLFGVDGFYVELSDRGYIGAIYPDEQGNIRAPDNNILMPADEVIKYLESPAELAEQLRVRIEPLQGEPIAPLTAPNLRPINIPPPAGQTRTPVIDWAKQADALLKVAVSIGGSIKAIANGTFRPQYGTSPYGTVRPQIGVPVRQRDGSTVVNNGNGTQTVRYPDGRVVTMPTTYTSTGMAGNYGQTLIPGVPNTALLIGGGLVIAALLLSRR
jgi:hypothetical protein